MTDDSRGDWDDGHTHAWVYFGGMASCSLCAATLAPGGKVSAPTRKSRQHQQLGKLAAKKKKRAR